MPCALAHGSSPDPVLSPLLYPPTCGSLVCGELGASVLPPVPIRDYLDHRGCRGSNIFSDVWHEGMTVVSVYSMGNEGLSVSPHGSKRHSLTVGFAVLQHAVRMIEPSFGNNEQCLCADVPRYDLYDHGVESRGEGMCLPGSAFFSAIH